MTEPVIRGKGELYIGEEITTEGDRSGTNILLDSASFTTHGVIVGMTGSGKTGLGVVLLEEALLSGIPVLAIDPKGDLSNLALTFPDLDAASFQPWMDEGVARKEDKTTDQLAADTAAMWSKGLASWGMDGADVGRLQSAAKPVIYTPGSTAGVPLDALGRLTAPESDDPSVRQDEADSTVSGLLGLVGVESDPLSGREHILLANLLIRAWDSGAEMDLPTLLGQIMDPPIRRLGVLELDTFFPAKDRQALAMKMNGLLASANFRAWSEGEPLDIQSMLWDDNDDPRAAIVSLAHLDESERHFAITLVLSRLISWMRNQSGTGELRCLVYIDEVMGLAPPVGNPATKKPILTLLKQARAFGVGLVLSTQNPVDLDYKAISNAGTWLIGRLQTEQDKARLVDGLRAADGSVDVAEIERTISGLGKRQFVLRTTKNSALPLFTTRWAMSYLAGPLTRDQISRLSEGYEPSSAAKSTSGPDNETDTAPEAALSDDESSVVPKTPGRTPVRYVHSAAPWLTTIDADPNSKRLTAALAARVNLLFDDTKSKLRHSEEWEAIIPLTGDTIDVGKAILVNFDDRDFMTDAPDGARYVLPEVELTAKAITSAKTDIKNELYTESVMTLHHNPELKLYGRPGESSEDFARRCLDVAEDGADAATNKIREKLEAKEDKLRDAITKAEDRVAELETQKEGKRSQQMVDIGTSILGSLLGGRKRSRSMASAARRMNSGRSQAANIESRLATAENRVAEKIEDLEQLEWDLREAVIEIDDVWADKATAIEPLEIPLEKTDIKVEDLMIVWLPLS